MNFEQFIKGTEFDKNWGINFLSMNLQLSNYEILNYHLRLSISIFYLNIQISPSLFFVCFELFQILKQNYMHYSNKIDVDVICMDG